MRYVWFVQLFTSGQSWASYVCADRATVGEVVNGWGISRLEYENEESLCFADPTNPTQTARATRRILLESVSPA